MQTFLDSDTHDDHLIRAILIIEQNPNLKWFTEFYKAAERMRVELHLFVKPETIVQGIRRGLKAEFGKAWKGKYPGFERRILEIYEQNKKTLQDKMTLDDK